MPPTWWLKQQTCIVSLLTDWRPKIKVLVPSEFGSRNLVHALPRLRGLLTVVAPLVMERGRSACGLLVGGHGLWSVGSVVVEYGLSALRHVESSQARDRTHVPFFDRQILNHWVTWEVPDYIFKDTASNFSHINMSWELGWKYIFWERYSSTHKSM